MDSPSLPVLARIQRMARPACEVVDRAEGCLDLRAGNASPALPGPVRLRIWLVDGPCGGSACRLAFALSLIDAMALPDSFVLTSLLLGSPLPH